MNLTVSKNGTVSSLELLKEINFWRAKEREGLLEGETDRLLNPLEHKNLLATIREEFKEEIDELELKPITYLDNSNRKQPCFNLTLSQAKQILVKESRLVRKAIIKYIEKLENIIKEKNSTEWLNDRKNGIMARRKETDAIQQYLIPLAIEQGSINYKMFYSNYTKLVHKYAGIENGMRNKCTRETLRYLEFLESAVENCIIIECGKNTHYKDIYQVCKHKCELLKDVMQPPTVKYIEDLELIAQN